jgi:hypothetical protein
MANRRLRNLLDRDELDWNDPRHRELYLREHINKDGHAYEDEEEEAPPRSSSSSHDNEDTATGNPQA